MMKKILFTLTLAASVLITKAQGVWAVTNDYVSNMYSTISSVTNMTLTISNDNVSGFSGTDYGRKVAVISDSGTLPKAIKGGNPVLSGAVPTSGTFYLFEPTANGTLIVAVIADNAPLYVVEENAAMSTESYVLGAYDDKGVRTAKPLGDDRKPGGQVFGAVEFNVKGGKKYYLYSKDAQLALAGFCFFLDRAVTIPSSGLCTMSSNGGLKLTGVDGLEAAYIVSSLTTTDAKLTAVTAAAPKTGVILKGTPGTELKLSAMTYAAAPATNYLQATNELTKTVEADYAYILKDGKFHPANAGTIPANRAYLLQSDIPTGANILELDFGDETGISAAPKDKEQHQTVYDLQGRKVSTVQPKSGLYIVNGKKVIIK